MKIKQTIFLAICLSGLGAGSAMAQQGQSAAGGEAYGTGGWVSYSIGQADYVTTNGTGGTITQGVQQPIEIFVMSGIEETNIQLKCDVYPNPAAEYVMLDIETPVTEQMNYLLYDTQGKVLSYQKIDKNETKISLNGLSNQLYYIQVLNNNKEVKTFKIIKNK